MKLIALIIIILFLPGCLVHMTGASLAFHHLDLWILGGVIAGGVGTAIVLDQEGDSKTSDEEGL